MRVSPRWPHCPTSAGSGLCAQSLSLFVNSEHCSRSTRHCLFPAGSHQVRVGQQQTNGSLACFRSYLLQEGLVVSGRGEGLISGGVFPVVVLIQVQVLTALAQLMLPGWCWKAPDLPRHRMETLFPRASLKCIFQRNTYFHLKDPTCWWIEHPPVNDLGI